MCLGFKALGDNFCQVGRLFAIITSPLLNFREPFQISSGIMQFISKIALSKWCLVNAFFEDNWLFFGFGWFAYGHLLGILLNLPRLSLVNEVEEFKLL
jgi:hypothetical protein